MFLQGFSYCHVASDNKDIVTNEQWPDDVGKFKTYTVLQYDEKFNEVLKWGKPALAKRPKRKDDNKNETKPIELFKLHLGNLNGKLKPKLPIDYKKAIIDYLREIGKVYKELNVEYIMII